ncbi:hypothetical protein STEG23_010214, partial [Scotinomys teguina]
LPVRNGSRNVSYTPQLYTQCLVNVIVFLIPNYKSIKYNHKTCSILPNRINESFKDENIIFHDFTESRNTTGNKRHRYRLGFSEMTQSMLSDKHCHYALYDATYQTKESKKEDLVFIIRSPECASFKSRMIYASSKDVIKKKLTGISITGLKFSQSSGEFAKNRKQLSLTDTCECTHYQMESRVLQLSLTDTSYSSEVQSVIVRCYHQIGGLQSDVVLKKELKVLNLDVKRAGSELSH